MPTTQIRGNTQIVAGTIGNAEIAAGAAIATSKLAEGADFLQRDVAVNWTVAQNAGGQLLTNLADPISGSDAATRSWVLTQTAATTANITEARMASTANLALTGVQTIDGVAGSANDVVLVKNQTTPAQNGVYTMLAGAWTRHASADTVAELAGLLVVVREGSATQADTLWMSSIDTTGVLDTTSVPFVQLPSTTDLLAGAGMTRTGQTFDVVAADNSFTVNADSVQVKLNATGAITVSGTGLQVAVDGTSVEVSSNALRLASGAAGAGLGYAAGVLAVNTGQANGGITTNADNVIVDKAIFVVRETPTGAVNGANTTYTLANTPFAGSEQVFLNGILQEPGAGNDYTISGTTITYLTAPATGDRLRVTYIKN